MKNKIDQMLPALKEEIKETRSITVSTLAELKRQYGEGPKLNEGIAKNERVKSMYSVSKTIPVKIERIVVNYKILSQMMNKLKNHTITFEIDNETLIVNYVNFNKTSKGKMVLKDISRYFKHFKYVPTLSLSDLQN